MGCTPAGKSVTIRLTEEEQNLWTAAADLANQSISQFLREAAAEAVRTQRRAMRRRVQDALKGAP